MAVVPEDQEEGKKSLGGSREGSEDRGEGPSSLSAKDKRKGKEKEVVEESTLTVFQT